jgi:hypothetical protein
MYNLYTYEKQLLKKLKEQSQETKIYNISANNFTIEESKTI